jgi:cardiolipin synthase
VNTPGQKPPRVDFALRIEGPLLVSIVRTMERVWAINELAQFQQSDVSLFPVLRRAQRMGAQTAKFLIRDNLRHRRDIEHSYLAAIRTAKREILIAELVFLPRHTVPPRADRCVRSAVSPLPCCCKGASSTCCCTTRRARCTASSCPRASRSRSTTSRSCTRRSR